MPFIKLFAKKIVITILTFEAKVVLGRHQPKIICITGSVGKTSTKDAIAAVLATTYKIRKSAKSYNGDLGVPLTVLNLKTAWSNPFEWISNILWGAYEMVFSKDYPEWLVLEVGADRPGEIEAIAKWLPCHVAVLTAFPDAPAHVEFFKSQDQVFIEDMQVAYRLRPDGVVIANGDDQNIDRYLGNISVPITTFGFHKNNDWTASKEALAYDDDKQLDGMTFSVEYQGTTYPVRTHGLLGSQQVYIILAALAVGVSQNVPIEKGLEELRIHHGPPGRLRIVAGIKNTTILDDTYNASPVAVKAGLDVLSKVATKGRRIAVLGDMLELGEYTITAHKEIGNMVGTFCDILITVGLRSKFIIEGARERGMKDSQIFYYDDSISAGKKLQDILEPNDVVLVKGSQGMRMEKVVEEVMAEPERKKDLLCRQDDEWTRR